MYKAILPTGDIFAVKCLHPPEETELPVEFHMVGLEAEMLALTETRHQNIVKMYGLSSFNGSMFFVESGSLGKLFLEETTSQVMN